jgi:hypothetical protein
MIAALIAAAALGQATPAPTVKVVQEKDKTVYRKRTVIDVCDGAELGGNRAEPGIAFYTARPARTFDSLIKLRVSFNDKLQTSTDDL